MSAEIMSCVGKACEAGLMFCGVGVEWGKRVIGKGSEMGVTVEDVMTWAMVMLMVWMLVLVGMWITKGFMEVMREEDDEGIGNDDGGEDGEKGEVRGKRDKSEEARSEVDGGFAKEEVKEKARAKSDGARGWKGRGNGKVKGKKSDSWRGRSDEGDPCMPDNHEWGEW